MKKLRWISVLVTVFCLGIMFSLTASAAVVSDSATDDTTDGAVAFTLGDTLKGSITETDNLDYYRFEIKTPGRVSFTFTSYMRYYCLKLINNAGETIWDTDFNEWKDAVGLRTDTYVFYLESGVYYIQANGYKYNSSYKSTGTYECDTDFKPSNVTYTGDDGTVNRANELALGGSAVGQISYNSNDSWDNYTVTLPSAGCLTVDITSYMQYYCLILLNQDGKEVYRKEYNEWTSSVGYRNDVYNLYLEPGKYYLQMNGYRYGTSYKSTGTYLLKTAFLSSGTSFSENDNSIAAAKQINWGQKYTGQISLNDDFDTYKFINSADKIPINITSYMQYYCIRIFDPDGNEVWKKEYNEWNSNVGYRRDTHEVVLNAGTYYIQVNGYKYGTSYKSVGKYELTLGTAAAPKPTAKPDDSSTGQGESVTPTDPPKTTGVIKMSATSIVMKKGQTTTALYVKKMAAGDKVKTVSTSNKKVVKVVYARTNGKIKLKALKTGNAKITVKLAGGKKAVVKVRVQAATVKTSKISGIQKKVTLKKGKSLTLKPQITPITSQEKVKYSSSNKKVATVSSKGKIKAKKKGTATITVKSGKKQVKCKVTVK